LTSHPGWVCRSWENKPWMQSRLLLGEKNHAAHGR